MDQTLDPQEVEAPSQMHVKTHGQRPRLRSWVSQGHTQRDTGGHGLVTTHAREVRIRRGGYKSVINLKIILIC